jgi:hypothetical protein
LPVVTFRIAAKIQLAKKSWFKTNEMDKSIEPLGKIGYLGECSIRTVIYETEAAFHWSRYESPDRAHD